MWVTRGVADAAYSATRVCVKFHESYAYRQEGGQKARGKRQRSSLLLPKPREAGPRHSFFQSS